MAKLVVPHACFALVILCTAVLVVPHAEAAITCGQVAGAVAPCINYVRSGGAVPRVCCGGIRGLAAAARTTADRRAVCNCLKSAAGSIPGINRGLAAGLPGKCGVNVGFPISTSVNCNTVN